MSPNEYWRLINFVVNESHAYLYFLVPFLLFEITVRGLALWKSARKNQTIWFVALLVINSLGILPVIYLLTNLDSNKPPKKQRSTK